MVLFELQVCIVYNDILGVATLSSQRLPSDSGSEQLLATRYFFSQFWCEFTGDVLRQFYSEDVLFRAQEAEIKAKMKSLDHLSEEQRQAEMVKLMENKSSIFQKQEITQRNFYLQLFRTYCELPFQDTMQTFAKVYNDVFVREKP